MKITNVEKPWGMFIQFTNNEKTTVKILIVKPNERLSLQSHKKRSEFWYVVEGEPTFVFGKKSKSYKPGDSIRINKKVKHRIINKSNKDVKILEIAIGIFDENDIIRYEDKYKRIK